MASCIDNSHNIIILSAFKSHVSQWYSCILPHPIVFNERKAAADLLCTIEHRKNATFTVPSLKKKDFGVYSMRHKLVVRITFLTSTNASSYCLQPLGTLKVPILAYNSFLTLDTGHPELVFLNVYGAPELIPRNEFLQPI